MIAQIQKLLIRYSEFILGGPPDDEFVAPSVESMMPPILCLTSMVIIYPLLLLALASATQLGDISSPADLGLLLSQLIASSIPGLLIALLALHYLREQYKASQFKKSELREKYLALFSEEDRTKGRLGQCLLPLRVSFLGVGSFPIPAVGLNVLCLAFKEEEPVVWVERGTLSPTPVTGELYHRQPRRPSYRQKVEFTALLLLFIYTSSVLWGQVVDPDAFRWLIPRTTQVQGHIVSVKENRARGADRESGIINGRVEVEFLAEKKIYRRVIPYRGYQGSEISLSYPEGYPERVTFLKANSARRPVDREGMSLLSNVLGWFFSLVYILYFCWKQWHKR
jgi:hypothetical protein